MLIIIQELCAFEFPKSIGKRTFCAIMIQITIQNKPVRNKQYEDDDSWKPKIEVGIWFNLDNTKGDVTMIYQYNMSYNLVEIGL